MKANADYLRLVPTFASVGEEHLLALASKCTRRRVAKGELVFLEGEEGSELLVIVSGRLRIERYSEAGESTTLAIRCPGECIGEMALLDGVGRSATAVAHTSVNLLVLGRNQFSEAVVAHPGLALSVMKGLSAKLREAGDQMLALATQSVGERVLGFLRSQCDESGTTKTRLSQRTIADAVAASRETVNRALTTLEGQGLVKRLGRGLYSVSPQD